MKLCQLITQYVIYRKSLGEKFKTNEKYLKSFCKIIGSSVDIKTISKEQINSFLYWNSKKITSGWFVKHTALLGFYQYALTRGYVDSIPLPNILPKRPPSFVPYIYSREELKLLFNTALIYPTNKSCIQPRMVQTVLILTYALGLRLHETLSITLSDIDLCNLVIIIKESKFYKSRLVPFNQEIKNFINKYLEWRRTQKQSELPNTTLFVGKNNLPFNSWTMRNIFQRIRKISGIKRNDNVVFQPRIHDLRHTFAVDRLISWYREKKNVQEMLPILSTYLGHKYLAHTTVYLTMTNDILNEANRCFEKYVRGELP